MDVLLMHEVSLEYWNKLTLLEQLGNIGSEVGRSIKAYKNNDKNCAVLTFSEQCRFQYW